MDELQRKLQLLEADTQQMELCCHHLLPKVQELLEARAKWGTEKHSLTVTMAR